MIRNPTLSRAATEIVHAHADYHGVDPDTVRVVIDGPDVYLRLGESVRVWTIRADHTWGRGETTTAHVTADGAYIDFLDIESCEIVS